MPVCVGTRKYSNNVLFLVGIQRNYSFLDSIGWKSPRYLPNSRTFFHTLLIQILFGARVEIYGQVNHFLTPLCRHPANRQTYNRNGKRNYNRFSFYLSHSIFFFSLPSTYSLCLYLSANVGSFFRLIDIRLLSQRE